MNRRNWLKASAVLAGGLAVFRSGISSVAAMPATFVKSRATRITDETATLAAPPEMKARLLANENPFGPSEKAKKAMQESLPNSYQYPFMYSQQLKQKIAAHEGIDAKQVLLDAGSSPLLLAAAMHFAKNGGSIITGDPSYDDLPEKAKRFKANIVEVPLTADYKLDLDAMEKKIDSTTSLVYICNPNNPTGTVLDTAKLKAFCERVSKKVPVFVDEAYIDYVEDPQGTTLIDLVKKGNNVIVARTFSKLYGFAGLRVGYVVAQPDMIDTLSMYSSGAFSISAPSIQAALVSYQDKEYMSNTLQKTAASKKFLYDTLKKEGYDYIPSSTNFVMFPLKMDGKRFADEMMKRGVGVRFWKFADKDWCRISIGRMDEMQAFADAFKVLA